MNSKMRLLGIFAVGCLAVIPMMNGCSNSPSPSTDGGTTTTDGGTTGTDAGMTGTDAGTPDLHGIGTRCTDSMNQPMSNCSRGLNCVGLVGNENMCTKLNCTQDSDCGTTGGLQNVCTGGQNAFCLRGCDPTATNSCGRTDFTCVTDQQAGVSFCIPDCRVFDYCGYPESCNMQTGDCSGSKQCSTGTDCASGEVCVADPNQSGTKVCVKDCTMSGNNCPMGFTCNMTSKACDPTPRQTYETCGAMDGQCVTNNVCVGFSSTAALCMQNCKADADCPMGSACSVKLQSNEFVCGVSCDPKSTDTNMGCPTGTQCLYQGQAGAGAGAMVTFCGLPQ